MRQRLDWQKFEQFVRGGYSASTARVRLSYAKRFGHLLESGDFAQIDLVSESIRDNVIKGLIILSKYLGIYEHLKRELKNRGIKWRTTDALSAFTRLYTNHNSDLGEWLIQVKPILRKEENLLLKFLRVTGLRASEGVASFNLIIEYAKKGKLNEYLTETGVLEHFRFKETFIRGTKNCFISVIAQDLISEIVESEPVSYFAIIKRLQRNGLKSRIGELRDFFGTFMLSHGLIREEIDLLQGRVGKSIFARFYWSPSFIELQGCLLKASAEMESKNGA